jgi:hypothetical protein
MSLKLEEGGGRTQKNLTAGWNLVYSIRKLLLDLKRRST